MQRDPERQNWSNHHARDLKSLSLGAVLSSLAAGGGGDHARDPTQTPGESYDYVTASDGTHYGPGSTYQGTPVGEYTSYQEGMAQIAARSH